jgi:hypothetical protein
MGSDISHLGEHAAAMRLAAGDDGDAAPSYMRQSMTTTAIASAMDMPPTE